MTNLNRHRIANVYGIFNDSFPPILDGVTLTVENYVKWLDARGELTCVVTPWNPLKAETGKDCKVMRYFSVPIHSRYPYRYGYPKLDPFIWKRMRETPFSLVHSHCPFSSGRLAEYAANKQNIPLIGTFHSKYRSDLEHSFKYAPWIVDMVMAKIIDFFNSCDHVWIPQAAVEETVREYGFKGEVTVVENGNDFADIVKGDLGEYKIDAKTRLGISKEKVCLLFVGQHILEKGVMTILEALVKIKEKYDFEMHFIGTGYAADDMKKYCEENGLSDYVTFHGQIENRAILSDYYAAADIFLFPSPYDNAPLVVREAAAFGAPAMLLAGSTASELVRDGNNGFLAGRGNDDFYLKLDSVLSDRDRITKVGIGAKETLVRSWKDVVDEVAGRYEDILSRFKGREYVRG